MRLANLQQRSLARAVGELMNRGVRRLLVTSTGSGEGKTSVTAALGRALAADARGSVVLVDGDAFKPTLHLAFRVGMEGGLGDLFADLYGVDLAQENAAQFGLGDWLELLRAQQRTGDLRFGDEARTYSLRIVKGAVSSIAPLGGSDGHRLGDLLLASGRITQAQREQALAVQFETGRPIGEVLCTVSALAPEELVPLLHVQVHHRLQELLRVRSGRGEFSELAESWLAVTGGRIATLPAAGCVDALLGGVVRSYLGDPYLSSQLTSYLRDTELPNLKVLPCGRRPADLMSACGAAPFELLLERLGRAFDIVIVDMPPVSLLTPTAALTGAADGVLMVVQAGRFELTAIQRAIEQVRRAGGHVVGAVLTHADSVGEAGLSPYYRVPATARAAFEESLS